MGGGAVGPPRLVLGCEVKAEPPQRCGAPAEGWPWLRAGCGVGRTLTDPRGQRGVAGPSRGAVLKRGDCGRGAEESIAVLPCRLGGGEDLNFLEVYCALLWFLLAPGLQEQVLC